MEDNQLQEGIRLSIINMLFDTFDNYVASNVSVDIQGDNLKITIYTTKNYYKWPEVTTYNLCDPNSIPNAQKLICSLINNNTIKFINARELQIRRSQFQNEEH